MAFSFCFCHHPQIGTKSGFITKSPSSYQLIQRSTLSLENVSRRHPIQEYGRVRLWLSNDPGLRSINQANLNRSALYRKKSRVVALCFQPSQIASSVFTLGTLSVLPLYTLMVVVPRAQLTRISMKSYIPYVILGLLYSYLLYLSWTPDTLQYMFGNSYWMPEFSGMLKMFSSEMTLASAWIHLLAIDLFAARQIYHDGLQNDIETRHSVFLCLLFCPIGVLTHAITKLLIRRTDKIEKQIH